MSVGTCQVTFRVKLAGWRKGNMEIVEIAMPASGMQACVCFCYQIVKVGVSDSPISSSQSSNSEGQRKESETNTTTPGREAGMETGH